VCVQGGEGCKSGLLDTTSCKSPPLVHASTFIELGQDQLACSGVFVWPCGGGATCPDHWSLPRLQPPCPDPAHARPCSCPPTPTPHLPALSCLLRFYGVEAHFPVAGRPQLLLSAEAELGITAGLQDRVIQVGGGGGAGEEGGEADGLKQLPKGDTRGPAIMHGGGVGGRGGTPDGGHAHGIGEWAYHLTGVAMSYPRRVVSVFQGSMRIAGRCMAAWCTWTLTARSWS
jgi:hypothetical protein